MKSTVTQLTKDITNVDMTDILSYWQWQVEDMKAVVTISLIGDIFFLGKDHAIYWFQIDTCELTKVADTLEHYEELLTDEANIDNWFLPLLVENLLTAGKTLRENEVYSYKRPPVLGGDYSVDNIEPTDMSVHFAFFGQICHQIRNLPDGTKVTIKYKSP